MEDGDEEKRREGEVGWRQPTAHPCRRIGRGRQESLEGENEVDELE